MKKIHDYHYGGIGFIFTLCLILFSCIPDDIELPFRVKSVVTDSVTNVTYCEAKLGGVVNVIDADTVTCGVIYSTYISFLSSKNGLKKPTTANGQYAVVLDLLDANTTYYYRAYAIDAGVYKYGEVLSFSTPEAPSVTTGEASAITHCEATLSGLLRNSEQSITCGFIYGTSSKPSISNDAKVDTLSQGAYTIKITDLEANTTYYYRAYAIVDDEYTYGEVRSFITESEKTEDVPSHEAVDLGLSVKWAPCNVGAESPEDYGDYFAWGETKTKSDYSSSTSITYGLSISVLKSRGIIGADGNLTAAYDAATENWGDEWRMPTKAELDELRTKCDWEWTKMNGLSGYKVTGPNGNSIFLPAAGIRRDTSLYDAGSYGDYWSATPYSDSYCAYGLDFNDDYYDWSYGNRGTGLAVRPVFGEPSQVVSISITTGEVSDITVNGATLIGTVSGAEQAVECGVIYGTSLTLSSTSGTAVTANSQGEYSVTVADLEPNTTYYYCAYVVVDGEYKYGAVKSFTTEQAIIEEPVTTSQTYTVNGVSFTMIDVEGGTFMMGSPNSDSDAFDEERPLHQVTLSSYAIGETEVTQELWQAVMGSNPSYYRAMQNPVERVSWNDCQTFIKKLNDLTGENFRLPTEAEWEYAARGGKESKGYKYSGSNTIDDVAWYSSNSSGKPHCVKLKKPNELGIYDMSGNVWEWCCDWFDNYSSSAQTNPTGPSSGSLRVYRGGSWYYLNARHSRVASRNGNDPAYAGSYNGLRLVRSDTPLQVVNIETGEVSDITANEATLSGTISGADQVVYCGVAYSTSSTLSSVEAVITHVTTTSQGEYSVTIADLEPNTTYYYRAYVIVNGENKYGEVKSFTTLDDYVEIPEGAVDLGLSVKWAPCNVGATTPEDYGDYFAWGETKTKSDYSSSTSITYGLSISVLKSRGIIGADGNLTAAYDAATENWGDEWRMPTKAELDELRTKCDWEWTKMNGLSGYKVTGPNGNSIFLPAAGIRRDTSLYDAGSYGDYWSATPYSDSYCAYGLDFNDDYYDWSYGNRGTGLAVRPVFGEPSQVVSISITTGEVSDITANGATLSGTVSGAGQAVDCGIIYSTSSTPSSTSGTMVATTSQGEYSVTVADLEANTTYYYRAFVLVDGEYKYGAVKSFTTEQAIIEEPVTSSQTYTVNGVSFTMIAVEGGTFTMGATSEQGSDAWDDEYPTHQVTLSDYLIGETEVTQELWQAVMGSNPSYYTGDLQRPVERVSWNNCQNFIAKLNELTGATFRLPTEAEWEYAARGGNKSEGYKYSGSNTIGDVAWYGDNSSGETHAVKTKQPNELGIYDMSGNVCEWCSDWYGDYNSSAQTNPTGSSFGSYRVLRGGSWGGVARDCRVSRRLSYSPGNGYRNVGLRLVRQFIP